MAQYTPHTWTTGDTIAAAQLNALEAAAAAAAVKADADAAYDAKGAATAAQAAAVQRANHTGTQSADTITDGATNKAYTATEKTKLAGVATGATANATDAALRDRSTHTGTQAASTVTGLAAVATSGAYGDLTGQPTIPAAYTDAQAVAANASGLAGKAPLYTPGAPNGDAGPAPVDALIETFQAGHGWTQFGTGTLTDDTADYVTGSQSVVTTTNGAGAQSKIRKTGYAAKDFTGRAVRVTFKVTNLARLADLKLRIGDTSMTNFYQAPLHSYRLYQGNPVDDFSATVRENEWITVTLPWSAFVVGSGTPSRANVTDYDILVQDNAAGTVTLHVNEIAAVPHYSLSPSGGIVTFWFDDGYISQATVAKPYLDKYGFAATLPIICDWVGSGAPYVTLAHLKAMERQSGWEICPHAFTSANHSLPNALADMTTAQVEADWENSRNWLLTNGLGAGRDVYAYPKGRFTVGAGSMEEAARRHFSVARTIDNTRSDAAPPQNPYRVLSGGYAYNTTTLASLKALVDQCVASGGWLNFTFHNLTASPTLATDYLTSDFQALVDYVAASGLPVMTASQAVRAMNSPVRADQAPTVPAARTLGAGPKQAVPGNDARLRDGSYRSSLLTLQGLSGENFRHELASGSSAVATGTVYYMLTPFTAGDVVNKLWVSTSGGSAGLTLARAGIYNQSTLAQLAAAPDNSGTAGWSGAGNKSWTLSAPWTCPATGWYYVAVLFTGTTAPGIGRSGNLVANAYQFGSGPANCASQATQTDLPATAVLTQNTFNSLCLWVGWN